jgi:GxxExxY protein
MEQDEVTQKIIGCAYKVSNTLGSGFLEKVYENALALEIHKTGLKVEQQYSLKVFYDGVVVGEYAADLLVENKVLIELKAVKDLDEIHAAQSMNYLKATGLPICLLINFGKSKIQIRRLVPYEIWQGKKPETLQK